MRANQHAYGALANMDDPWRNGPIRSTVLSIGNYMLVRLVIIAKTESNKSMANAKDITVYLRLKIPRSIIPQILSG